MKRKYMVPGLKMVDLTTEDGILSGSQHTFEVGMSNDAMNGSEALSHQKHEIWGDEDIWK